MRRTFIINIHIRRGGGGQTSPVIMFINAPSAWDSSLRCVWINSRCPLLIFVTSCVSSPHVAKPGAHLTIWFQSFRTMTQTHISTLNEHIGPCCIIGAWNMANKGTIYQFVHQNMIQILSYDEHQTDCNERSCGNQHHKNMVTFLLHQTCAAASHLTRESHHNYD